MDERTNMPGSGRTPPPHHEQAQKPAPTPRGDRPPDPTDTDVEAIDVVEEASRESFPASDAPAWTGGTTVS